MQFRIIVTRRNTLNIFLDTDTRCPKTNRDNKQTNDDGFLVGHGWIQIKHAIDKDMDMDIAFERFFFYKQHYYK